MNHAADTLKQLTTLLEPQFSNLTDNVAELKTSINDLQKTISDLTTVVITATDDIKVLKEDRDKQSAKLDSLEQSTRENADGVCDYKKTKAIVVSLASIVVGALVTACGFLIDSYYENKHHEEEMAYRKTIQDSYANLALAVSNLEKKVGNN